MESFEKFPEKCNKRYFRFMKLAFCASALWNRINCGQCCAPWKRDQNYLPSNKVKLTTFQNPTLGESGVVYRVAINVSLKCEPLTRCLKLNCSWQWLDQDSASEDGCRSDDEYRKEFDKQNLYETRNFYL